jgi:four helix bundle protein
MEEGFDAMGKVISFEDLEVWQKSHRLALEIYRVTGQYPTEEKFGIVTQMRRAAVSIPANIAEGFKKMGRRDKINFYNIAQGSLSELKYFIILSKDLGYLTDFQAISTLIEDVGRMLNRLILSAQSYARTQNP